VLIPVGRPVWLVMAAGLAEGQSAGLVYLDASRASSGSMSRTIAQTAAIRASRPEESALLRSASSWSMASATRRIADSSIEHTVEDYQVGGACKHASVSPVIHRPRRPACGQKLWITGRGNPREVFLPHSRWITFPLLIRSYPAVG